MCSRGTDKVDLEHTDMTLDQVKYFVDTMKKTGHKPKVKITGGEPLIHPQFYEIMDILRYARRHGYIRRIMVLTNGTIEFKQVPYRIFSTVSPPNEKKHLPFWISPHDLCIQAVPRRLTPQLRCRWIKCGNAYDYRGFSQCQFIHIHDLITGQNNCSDMPVTEINKKLCKHCIWSIAKPTRDLLFEAAAAGKFPYPTKFFEKMR